MRAVSEGLGQLIHGQYCGNTFPKAFSVTIYSKWLSCRQLLYCVDRLITIFIILISCTMNCVIIGGLGHVNFATTKIIDVEIIKY